MLSLESKWLNGFFQPLAPDGSEYLSKVDTSSGLLISTNSSPLRPEQLIIYSTPTFIVQDLFTLFKLVNVDMFRNPRPNVPR
jgi:hypothetical protein